ncbi:MAG TPA: uroporphyrinogen decarboxylase family protein [Acidobacteriota bacterium]|jgi:hypothetical protein|nr:uroporphyrinogen decarboxylase family protein [Acidobacteriota bacterium]
MPDDNDSVTVRSRIKATLEGRLPDRVPVSIYEMSHLALGAWYLGEPSAQPLLDSQRELGDSIVKIELNIVRWIDDPYAVQSRSEMVGDSTLTTQTIRTPQGDLTAVYRTDPGVATTWQVKPFVESVEDARKFLSISAENHRVDLEPLRRQISHAGEDAFVVVSLGDTLGYVVSLFHYDNFALMLMDDEALIMDMMRLTHQALRAGLEQVCAEARGIGFRFWGPEYAGPTLLHPRYFEKLVVNFLSELIPIVRDSGNYAVLHVHGKLRGILDMIEALHPHALEPLEVLPAATADVSMEELKERLGGKVALWGGIQCNELDNETPEYIDVRVKEIMAAGKAGGGYLMLPTGEPIEIPISPQIAINYRAYFEAGRKYGGY